MTKYSVKKLFSGTTGQKRHFKILVFLGLLWNLSLLHSVSGCPERCKCTEEKSPFFHDPFAQTVKLTTTLKPTTPIGSSSLGSFKISESLRLLEGSSETLGYSENDEEGSSERSTRSFASFRTSESIGSTRSFGSFRTSQSIGSTRNLRSSSGSSEENPNYKSSVTSRSGTPWKTKGGNISIDCEGAELHKIPKPSDLNGIDPRTIIQFDLSDNRITEIQDNAFKLFPNLKYITLSNNRISRISSKSFQGLQELQVLFLNSNHLPAVIKGVFPPSLLELSLEDNFLTLVPSAITTLHKLKSLNLASNKISVIHEGDLRGLSDLLVLTLDWNKIVEIENRALTSLSSLQTLDVSNNLLTEVPSAILLCQDLVQLHFTNNRINWISQDAFQKLTKLEDLVLTGNPLERTHKDAFRNLPSLKKLILKESRKMSEFPNLVGTSGLELIRIDRAAIEKVPEDICNKAPKLRSLVLHRNEIDSIPILDSCHLLRLLDLSNNKIEEIDSFTFEKQLELQDLLLQNNFITEIFSKAFVGLTKLQVLNLENNLIITIHPDSFLPLVSLEDINVGNNQFPKFPSRGLERVVNLKAHNNIHLREFPDPESFPAVHSLALSYAYHCCPFLSHLKPTRNNGDSQGIVEDVVYNVDGLKDLDPTFWNVSSVWPDLENTEDFAAIWANLASAFPDVKSETTSALTAVGTTTAIPTISNTINCIPKPGPFMPCKDLFDWWTLRCGVWIVFLLALLGNGAVVIVLVFARAKMDVPRFLVTNLAMADFFMGIYLGFLAVVDASTLGEFRMYAIQWQMSAACQTAGFFGVLSSELSVFTLTVITLERNYAITHAMHLNKRLSLRHAAYIMTIGWGFAIVMATLPIIGVSDYRKFAVCLPFETDDGGLAYVIFIMFINGVAFVILMGCYLKIYCAIRGSQAWNSNDSRIAKRMALLVFTDFLCWAPIAFFSLTAASGLQLISLEEAKIFTIFILPFNSCCNPFLYALLTKQFKKDCVMLCKSIEESRVTRGIGRCRHSSNFSNRQTPANTNSAIDPVSKGSKPDSQVCICQNKQKEHRKLKNRLRVAAMKYFFCNKEMEELNSSSDYSYQQGQNTNKGKRNASLSSETYSSSWSDTFKKGNTPVALRILDKKKPHSWLLSRKPSQDSNLSSSRNDSSATTASTSTWRISRSSVSSDISSGSSKVLVKTDTHQGNLRISSLRDRLNESRPVQHPQVMVMQNASSTGSWVSSLIKSKPKLQRQIAMEKDSSFLTKKNDLEVPICPMHKRDNLSCVYEQESYEEDETHSMRESDSSYLTPNFSSTGIKVSVNPPAVKIGFASRKLSTISSRSVSINKDGNKNESFSSPITEDNGLEQFLQKQNQIYLAHGRCASLSMLYHSPIKIKAISDRFPSEGHLSSIRNSTSSRHFSKSSDCLKDLKPEPLEENIKEEERAATSRKQSSKEIVVSETTALMSSSDCEDTNDVFLVEKSKVKRHYEAHFPVEGGDAETTLINEAV